MLNNPSNFTLISFSCELVNNFELMFWKGGTNKNCHNIPTWRFWTTACVMYCWPVLLFEITIVCIGNFLLYIPILCNFYISLTKYFVSLDTNWTLVNFGVKADFLITPQPWRKNMIIFLTTNRIFTSLRLNFNLRLTAVKSGKDKRNYNRLLFIER